MQRLENRSALTLSQIEGQHFDYGVISSSLRFALRMVPATL